MVVHAYNPSNQVLGKFTQAWASCSIKLAWSAQPDFLNPSLCNSLKMLQQNRGYCVIIRKFIFSVSLLDFKRPGKFFFFGIEVHL